MSEVITRPKTSKTPTAKAVPTSQQSTSASTVSEDTPQPEWSTLALPHVRKLSDFLYTLAGCSEAQKAPEPIQNLIEQADALLARVWGDESGSWATNDALLWLDLNTVVLLLGSASYACQHGPLSHVRMTVHVSIIDAALAYATGLSEAVFAVTEDLSPLQLLDGDIYLRMKPGDRPTLTTETTAITPSTTMTEAAEIGKNQALDCSYLIEEISNEMILLAEELRALGQRRYWALLNCHGTRINALNGLVMGFLDNDAASISEAHSILYAYAKELNMAAGGAA